MTAHRGQTRSALTVGLRSACPSCTVFAYQVKDFGGLSPVLVVTSAGSERERVTMRGSAATFIFAVHVFVAFARDDDDTSYTDLEAENLLDQIEAEIAAYVDQNQRTTDWHALAYQRTSDAGTPATIGGVEYRHELITLAVSVM